MAQGFEQTANVCINVVVQTKHGLFMLSGMPTIRGYRKLVNRANNWLKRRRKIARNLLIMRSTDKAKVNELEFQVSLKDIPKEEALRCSIGETVK